MYAEYYGDSYIAYTLSFNDKVSFIKTFPKKEPLSYQLFLLIRLIQMPFSTSSSKVKVKKTSKMRIFPIKESLPRSQILISLSSYHTISMFFVH